MALQIRSSQCPNAPPTAYITGEPISGSFTFQEIIIIVGWVCFGLTILLWLGLVIPHLRRYNVPDEQRQIFRIILTPLMYAIFAMPAIHDYSVAPYLAAVPSLYEAWALASLFLLYVHFVAPAAHTREDFFAQVEHRKQNGEIVPGGTLKLFRVCAQPSVLLSSSNASAATLENSIHLSCALYNLDHHWNDLGSHQGYLQYFT